MKTKSSLLHRSLVFAYGVAAYAMFGATGVYAAGFLGNFLVPKSIDSTATLPFWTALLVNCSLLTLFAVQHSVMARPAFKRWWTRFVPQPAERSTYVVFSCLALAALFLGWQPMGGVIWQVENSAGRIAIYAAYVFGWALVLFSTHLINHFDLFGLRQVSLHFRGQEYTELKFATPSLYQYVRHPLYLGWFFTFWATPTMTVAHLVFALATTAYMRIAIRWEERDLMTYHPEYAGYRRRVPMLIPRRKRAAQLSAQPPRGASKNVIVEAL